MKHSFKEGDLVKLQYYKDGFYYGDNGLMNGRQGIVKEVYPEKLYVKLEKSRSIVTVIPEECLLMGTSGGFTYDVPEQLPPPPQEIIVPVEKPKTITLLSSSTTLTVNQNF